jgi:hypothetical protein
MVRRRRNGSATWALAAVLFGGPVAAHAQPPTLPAVGARVRITTFPPPLTRIGTYGGAQDSTLLLQTPPSSLSIPLGSIRKLEVSRGAKLSKWGGVGGLLLGAGAGGFVLGCLANRDDYGVLCGGQSDTKVVVGAVVGGLAGAAIGAVLFRRESWIPVGNAATNYER